MGFVMTKINELRFVERDGKKILQQYKEHPIFTETEMFSGRQIPKKQWFDVPFVSIEELQK